MHREALANALNRMCTSREERIRMGKVGKARVEKFFRHQSMMEKYNSLLKGVRLWLV